MNEAYVSGQNEILNLAFQTAIAGKANFYVGLGTGPIPEGNVKTLADVVEVTGAGYAREEVERSAGVLGWTLLNGVLTSPTLTFTNTGSEDWTDADYAFLTLSPSGTTAPVTLFSSSELSDTFILAASQTKQIVVNFSLLS